jgi:hypothetical protein
MGRKAEFAQGSGSHRIVDTHLYEEHDSGANIRELTLHVPGEESPVASLTYAVDEEAPGQAQIENLESRIEGKGYAQTLLHHLYQNNPSGIAWGTLVHPASRHLLNKFDKLYGHSSFGSDAF